MILPIYSQGSSFYHLCNDALRLKLTECFRIVSSITSICVTPYDPVWFWSHCFCLVKCLVAVCLSLYHVCAVMIVVRYCELFRSP